MVSKRIAAQAAEGLSAILLICLSAGIPALAQQQSAPPRAVAPDIDQTKLTQLIWNTMAAVDQANQTGNYSVLRDLGAPGFQANNDAAKLAQIFAALRSSGVDLSSTLLLAPTFRSQPRMVQADMVQVQGVFGMRPTAISFELLYQWAGGKWRLFGVAIAPVPMAGEQQTQPARVPRKK